jgi:formylglycine-generating enzyme required for sulfatase activity
MELIQHCARHGQLPKLAQSGMELRPDIAWPTVPAPEDKAPPSAESRARLVTGQPFLPDIVLIPAGKFLMGSDPRKDGCARDDEQPQHVLFLPEYHIARTPVTNDQYLVFTLATGYAPPAPWEDGKPPPGVERHPAVLVSWHDAMAYCRWLAKITGKPYALPSEAEWEKGARGTDGRIFPWGDQWDPARCGTSAVGTTPTGACPQGASPYGLQDVAGNVWEWTRSLGTKYPYIADDGREVLETKAPRVVRGGSFNNPWAYLRCASRLCYDPSVRDRDIGFRIVISPP